MKDTKKPTKSTRIPTKSKAAYYTQQFAVTKRNKARRAAKRAFKAAYWKERKAAAMAVAIV